jgi:hypothetical protein
MDLVQWLTVGLGVMNVILLGGVRYVISVERRLARIEQKLGITD